MQVWGEVTEARLSMQVWGDVTEVEYASVG